jgi:hypothetical protein
MIVYAFLFLYLTCVAASADASDTTVGEILPWQRFPLGHKIDSVDQSFLGLAANTNFPSLIWVAASAQQCSRGRLCRGKVVSKSKFQCSDTGAHLSWVEIAPAQKCLVITEVDAEEEVEEGMVDNDLAVSTSDTVDFLGGVKCSSKCQTTISVPCPTWRKPFRTCPKVVPDPACIVQRSAACAQLAKCVVGLIGTVNAVPCAGCVAAAVESGGAVGPACSGICAVAAIAIETAVNNCQ